MNKEVQVGDKVRSLITHGSTKEGDIYTIGLINHGTPSGVWLKETLDYLIENEFEVIQSDDSNPCEVPPKDTGLIDKQEHYTANGIQPIELMRQNFTPEAFQGFLEGNIIKYVLRHRRKNGVEDLRKAMTYLTWLIDEEENE